MKNKSDLPLLAMAPHTDTLNTLLSWCGAIHEKTKTALWTFWKRPMSSLPIQMGLTLLPWLLMLFRISYRSNPKHWNSSWSITNSVNSRVPLLCDAYCSAIHGVKLIACLELTRYTHTLLSWAELCVDTVMNCPYPEPVVFQWQSSGNPMCLELRPQCTLECHWRKNVDSQCASSGFPLVFQCVPIMQINSGSPLGQHRVLASASVVPVAAQCPVAPQCTCCSSGLPVCSNYAN